MLWSPVRSVEFPICRNCVGIGNVHEQQMLHTPKQPVVSPLESMLEPKNRCFFDELQTLKRPVTAARSVGARVDVDNYLR